MERHATQKLTITVCASPSPRTNVICRIQSEKGTKGIDGRVISDKGTKGIAGKGQRAFVITLGRAGEDNKQFKLSDLDSTFSSFSTADYDLQVRHSG